MSQKTKPEQKDNKQAILIDPDDLTRKWNVEIAKNGQIISMEEIHNDTMQNM